MNSPKRFPNDFLWGAATSAYQIEGSPLADGAGASIWHRFSHTPGRVANGDTGDIACDHYRQFKVDVKLMERLGLNAYRFSVSWGRVLPEGRGHVNAKGLGFYERLVDTLLAHGIQPVVTLYHWDLPAALDNRGGWLNGDIANWFADYARVLFHALDDRVKFWITLNEPWVITDGGYLHGTLAPGHRNLFEVPSVSHNLLRAHASAVQVYRAEGHGQIGIAINLEPKYPVSQREQDRAATARAEAYVNRQYLDPIFHGSYPEELREIFADAWLELTETDLRQIQQPIDFLGINYYTRGVTRYDPTVSPLRAVNVPLQEPQTDMGWEIYPQGLTDTLGWIKARYGTIPVYITENGAAFRDPSPRGGQIQDTLRVNYLRDHMRAAYNAMQNGVNLRGYFVWSLLDNFEWRYGYSKRFGIVHVDYATQVRTTKSSAHFYSEAIRTNGAKLFTSPMG
jgi:beta-glucosidase